ncbi:hypothetical protein RhiirB3_408896 [Rhizophagus irregularis]|nr:hypothetical protein RhiirB3_408896 [Rhizophagus irregularis]
MKISRIKSSTYSNAIYEQYNNGFNFGYTFYMNSDQNIYLSNQGYYDNNIGNVLSPYLNQISYFAPEEIEVFKITTT